MKTFSPGQRVVATGHAGFHGKDMTGAKGTVQSALGRAVNVLLDEPQEWDSDGWHYKDPRRAWFFPENLRLIGEEQAA